MRRLPFSPFSLFFFWLLLSCLYCCLTEFTNWMNSHTKHSRQRLSTGMHCDKINAWIVKLYKLIGATNATRRQFLFSIRDRLHRQRPPRMSCVHLHLQGSYTRLWFELHHTSTQWASTIEFVWLDKAATADQLHSYKSNLSTLLNNRKLTENDHRIR